MMVEVKGTYEDGDVGIKRTHSIKADGLPCIARQFCPSEVFTIPKTRECYRTDCLDCWINVLQDFEKIEDHYSNTLILEKRSTK